MRYPYHFVTAVGPAATVAVALGANERTLFLVLAGGALGAGLPDADEPNSKVGRRLGPLSHLIKRVFGHRGVTHSLWAVAAVAGLVGVLYLVWGAASLPFTLALLWGYVAHVYAGDLFTRSGVHLFSLEKSVGIPSNVFARVKVGSSRETLLLFLSSLASAGGIALAAFWDRIPIPAMPSLAFPALPGTWWAWAAGGGALLALSGFVYIRWRNRLAFSRRTVTWRIDFNRLSDDAAAKAESLFNVIHACRLPRRIRLFRGQPHITITYAAFKDEQRRGIYLTLPDAYEILPRVRNAVLTKFPYSVLESADWPCPFAVEGHRRKYGRLKQAKHSAYTLRTLDRFAEDDPIEYLFNALSIRGEASWAQLMIKPVGSWWTHRARRLRERARSSDTADGSAPRLKGGVLPGIAAVIRGIDDNTPSEILEPEDRRRELSDEVKNLVADMDTKIDSRSAYRFELRIATEKKTRPSFYELEETVGAFRQLDYHNQLTWNRCYPPWSWLMARLFSGNLWPVFGSRGILSASELSVLLHPPYKSTVLLKMDRNRSRSAPLHRELMGLGPGKVVMGVNSFRLEDDLVTVPIEDLKNHVFLLGRTRSGKTSLAKALIQQWMDQIHQATGKRFGCLYIEPHGDATREIISSLPDRHLDRCYLIDPGDTDWPIAFNPLAYRGRLSTDQLRDLTWSAISSVWNITTSMSQLQTYFPNLIDVLLRTPGAHFGWAEPFLTVPDFRHKVLEDLDDPGATMLWKAWEDETPMTREAKIKSTFARVDRFRMDRRIKSMFGQKECKLDLLSAMNEGKCIFAHLGVTNAGDVGGRLLGCFLLGMVHFLSHLRTKEERLPFLVVIDESHKWLGSEDGQANPAGGLLLSQALSEDGKFGLTYMIAHQYLSQLKTSGVSVLDSIRANTSTRISFVVGEDDARELAPLFCDIPEEAELRKSASDLSNLAFYQAYMKCNVGKRPVPATTFTPAPPLEALSWENLERAKLNTHRDFCRQAGEVSAEIEEFEREIYKIAGLGVDADVHQV